jgi:hypothetical protein
VVESSWTWSGADLAHVAPLRLPYPCGPFLPFWSTFARIGSTGTGYPTFLPAGCGYSAITKAIRIQTNLIFLFLSLRPIIGQMNIHRFTDNLMRLEQALRDGQPSGGMSLMRTPEQMEALIDVQTTYTRSSTDAVVRGSIRHLTVAPSDHATRMRASEVRY